MTVCHIIRHPDTDIRGSPDIDTESGKHPSVKPVMSGVLQHRQLFRDVTLVRSTSVQLCAIQYPHDPGFTKRASISESMPHAYLFA